MAASYPGSLKSFTTKTDKVDLVMAAHVNDLQLEVVALETELGTDVAGSLTDLKTRLAISIGDAGGIKGGTSLPGTPTPNQLFVDTDAAGGLGILYRRFSDDSDWDTIASKVPATKVVAASDSVDTARADYVCDGTDDDVQIQQAIDALDAAGTQGGRVILLEGTYVIGSTVTMATGDEGLILQGQGWHTVLQAKLNLNDEVLEITADRMIVRDLKVDVATNAQSTNASAVEFQGADHCVLDNVWITSAMADDHDRVPLQIDDCDFMKVTKCRVHASAGYANTRGIITIAGDSVYALIEGCFIDGQDVPEAGSTTSCITGDGTTTGFDRSIIKGNIMIGSANTEYGVWGQDGHYENNTIVGNIIFTMDANSVLLSIGADNNIVDGNQCEQAVSDLAAGSVVGDNKT